MQLYSLSYKGEYTYTVVIIMLLQGYCKTWTGLDWIGPGDLETGSTFFFFFTFLFLHVIVFFLSKCDNNVE